MNYCCFTPSEVEKIKLENCISHHNFHPLPPIIKKATTHHVKSFVFVCGSRHVIGDKANVHV